MDLRDAPPEEQANEHRRLIERTFPELSVVTLRAIGTGWTFDTYELNGEWIAQLPRSDYAHERLLREMDVLPLLATELSTSIPSPVFVSADPVVMIYPKLAGDRADEAPDGLWPERLGRALYGLHSVPPEFIGLRAKPAEQARVERRRSLADLAEVVVSRLSRDDAARAESLVESYLDDDRLWRFEPCIVHDDLAPEHVLVSDTGDLVGILDWEDVDVGDPASDFVWLMGTGDAGPRTLAAYGGAPDATFLERT